MSTVMLRTETTFVIVECCRCGVQFGLTAELNNARLRTKEEFWCPNGHRQTYMGETFEQQLCKANARTAAVQDQLDAANREAERIAHRTANGVCPCCHRTFVQLARHMRAKHPAYSTNDTP